MKEVMVVVDMQNDFINGPLGTPEARAIVDNICKKIRAFDGPILVTMDTHGAGYLATQEGKLLPVAHCEEYSHGWLVHKDVSDALREHNRENPGSVLLYRKETFGDFNIAQFIQDYKADVVTLVGVCTDICVVSNALIIKSFNPEVQMTVDASCCAGTTPDNHKAALKTMESCQILVINND